MKIELNRLDDAFHLQAVNDVGKKIETDGAPGIGGGNKGFRPMQLVLTAVASCSSIDIISILKKQRQPLDDIKIEATGEREKDAVPAVFTDIHLHYKLYGKISADKAEKAIDLSVNKYCSVSKMLDTTVNITTSFEIF